MKMPILYLRLAEFVNIRPPETGFPLKEVRTTTNETAPPTGVRRYSDSINESEVTQFEEGPLDPALFEVPPGFKRVIFQSAAA